MPTALTEITEIATGLGALGVHLNAVMSVRPDELRNVDDPTWQRLQAAYTAGEHRAAFEGAFANGAALLAAEDGLRGRVPRLIEWKGPHRQPGDDVIPADIRIDHVYQISCKYFSKILQNCGPSRLFDRLLIGETRAPADWFHVVAPAEYQLFYDAVRAEVGGDLPEAVVDLTPTQRSVLKHALRPRGLPPTAQDRWIALSSAVARASARRWTDNLRGQQRPLRMLWRLLRIGDAPYFVLGTDGRRHLRLRVGSAWDWSQAFELRSLSVASRTAGQPEVTWEARVHDRASLADTAIVGHVEIRWSHGRFQGSPEAKIYLDTPPSEVPGYHPLV